jgi:hypothetical protein
MTPRPQDWPHPWPGDEVTIRPLSDCPARVEEVSVGRMGVSLRVAYWVDGRRMSEWLDPEEVGP